MVRLAVSMGLALQSPYLRRRISFNFAEIAGCKRRVAAPASQHGGAPLQRGRPARTWEFSPGASMHTLATVSLQALRAQTPEAQALQAMTAALRAGHPLAVAYSGGKDSSVLANLALAAACQVLAEGGRAVLAVTHADVGAVENPEIRALVRGELACMRRFAAAKGLDLRVRIARPALPPSLAVLMTGVRREESTGRAGSIARRGETAGCLWQDQEGRLRLSPLLDWTVDDVWSYLGLCRQGAIEAYSSFDEVLGVYQDAGGSSCVVVADAEMERHAKPCASRFGCWACTAVREDRSLRQMIDSDPARYGYLRPLAALRDFIAHSQYDWNRRQFIGRTIRNGFITIAADTYAPSMLAELLRYALSAQKATGIEIVSAAQLIAIDVRWSLYALAEPFAALRIWREVEQGASWTPPSLAPVPKTEVPRYGLIHVGGDWDDEIQSDLVVTGLRDTGWEMFSESCGPKLRTLRNGRTVMDIEGMGDIDEEAAWTFLDFEADRMLDDRPSFEDDWTAGYRTYLRYGLIEPGKGASRHIDSILRRSQWRQRHGLHGQQELAALRGRLTVRFERQGDLFEDAADVANPARGMAHA